MNPKLEPFHFFEFCTHILGNQLALFGSIDRTLEDLFAVGIFRGQYLMPIIERDRQFLLVVPESGDESGRERSSPESVGRNPLNWSSKA